MADYELYLTVLLCMGAIILSACLCIWMLLSTGKFGKEHGPFPIPAEATKLAEGALLRKPELEEAGHTLALQVTEELSVSTLLQEVEINLEGSRGDVLRAYFKSMKAVERGAEISMKPQMTLREFLKETIPELGEATEAFAQLTSLAEKALYSHYVLKEDRALWAENLALKVERSIRLRYDSQ